MTEQIIRTLRSLQLRQYKHDQLAHQDIGVSLSVPKRLTHFTLHFSKYLGAIARATRENRLSDRAKAIADSFIICLACANSLNVDLELRLTTESGYRRDVPSGPYGELARYTEIVGDMAKACEAIDHLEAFPSRKVLEDSIVQLTAVVLRMAADEGIGLIQTVEDRWMRAESKSFLFQQDAPSSPLQITRVA